MLFHRELEENLHVCQHCGFHMRLDPIKRLQSIFDDGAYDGVELPKSVADPLKFRDQKRYTDRLKEAQVKRAVELSAEKYCSASIMLGRAGVAISHDYEIIELA